MLSLNRPSRVQYFITHGVPYLPRAACEINKWSSAYPLLRPREIIRNNGAPGGCPAGPTRRRDSLRNWSRAQINLFQDISDPRLYKKNVVCSTNIGGAMARNSFHLHSQYAFCWRSASIFHLRWADKRILQYISYSSYRIVKSFCAQIL